MISIIFTLKCPLFFPNYISIVIFCVSFYIKLKKLEQNKKYVKQQKENCIFIKQELLKKESWFLHLKRSLARAQLFFLRGNYSPACSGARLRVPSPSSQSCASPCCSPPTSASRPCLYIRSSRSHGWAAGNQQAASYSLRNSSTPF